jgi:hypothetical protein
MMEARTTNIKTILPNNTPIYIQARALGGDEDIAFKDKLPSFDQIAQAIEGITQSLTTVWDKVKPSKANVELNVEIALESGQLIAMLVNGSATASMKITLEWDKTSSS